MAGSGYHLEQGTRYRTIKETELAAEARQAERQAKRLQALEDRKNALPPDEFKRRCRETAEQIKANKGPVTQPGTFWGRERNKYPNRLSPQDEADILSEVKVPPPPSRDPLDTARIDTPDEEGSA